MIATLLSKFSIQIENFESILPTMFFLKDITHLLLLVIRYHAPPSIIFRHEVLVLSLRPGRLTSTSML